MIVHLRDYGRICCDSTIAIDVVNQILPTVQSDQKIVLDFKDIRVINSSFSNALFGTLASLRGLNIIKQLTIRNACDIVKSQIKSSIIYGLNKPI